MPVGSESDLLTEVYIDESSQNAHDYLVIGGIIIPRNHSAWLDAQLVAARGDKLPTTYEDGRPRIIKWEKVKGHNYKAYMDLVDAFVTLGGKLPSPFYLNFLKFHAIAADLRLRNVAKYSEGDEDIAFSKELSFLCVHRFGRLHNQSLFNVYPDRRATNITERQARDILNFSIAKRNLSYERKWPFRDFRFKEPEDHQALQMVDILCGGIAYRLNHSKQPVQAKGKAALSAHIWKKLNLREPLMDSFTGRPFTLFYRKYGE